MPRRCAGAGPAPSPKRQWWAASTCSRRCVRAQFSFWLWGQGRTRKMTGPEHVEHVGLFAKLCSRRMS
eukprot:2312550-Alexandrium_andersonii.AAC.2